MIRGARRLARGMLERLGIGPGAEVRRSYGRWRRDRGDETLSLDHGLVPDDVALDIGGFTGDWAAKLLARSGCRIHVFEPVPDHVAALRARFAGDPRVSIHPFGLGDRDQEVPIALAGAGSSTWRGEGPRVQILIRDAAAALAELGIGEVGLAKVNIEGGEYALLPRLAERGWLPRLRRLQVQFHLDAAVDARKRREDIRGTLAGTHTCAWDYPFIWECWCRRDEAGA